MNHDLETTTTMQPTTLMQATESARGVSQVQAAAVLAKKYPRDIFQCVQDIVNHCKSPSVARSSQYRYPKGGATVSGPSIRLAEVLAQNWGNLDIGYRELERRDNESDVEVHCWDMQSNVRQSKVFTVKHEIGTRRGPKALTDPRDITEHIANQAARKQRSCILAVIPKNVIEDAVEQCNKTLAPGSKKSLTESLNKLLANFLAVGVSKEMIEDRLGHALDLTIEAEFLELIHIHTSLKDKASDRKDWFKFKKENDQSTEDLNSKLSTNKKI